ncbi:hypothetical protein OH76DRAFT_1407691 [Lentinus brumalis]|uniref:F-box domain-containing protein n=1 Tax=Lentinus brumalis TaxID=2498619 RepID=A0A371CZK7_9APHY|nr:hypothetical protein OH76DRAFT_1407691 [Polyporus brumalis]
MSSAQPTDRRVPRAYLSTTDILHLSRVSKGLRATLESPECRIAWLRALRSVPDLPPCPNDMSETLYTALVFGRNCFACGANEAYEVDYALRVRYCETCYNDNVVDGAALLKDLPDPIRDVVMLVLPAATSFECYRIRRSISRTHPLSHIMQDYYLRRSLEDTVRWASCLTHASVEDVAALKPAIRQRINDVLQRQVHAVLLDCWERLIDATPENSHDDVSRRARILSLLRSNKHLELPSIDLDDLDSDDDDNYCEVQECDLAPEVLRSSCGKSREQTVQEAIAREDRMEVVHETLLQARYREIEDCYQRLVEMRLQDYCDPKILPNRYDGARLWGHLAYRDSSRRTITQDNFLEEADDTYADAISSYREAMKRALASLIPQPQDDKDCTRMLGRCWSLGSVLLLPEALFSCIECGKSAIPWPDINDHWRTAHPNKSIWFDKDGEKLNVRWWRRGASTAFKILRAADLEQARNTYVLNVWISSGKLLCICSDPSLRQPPHLTWPELVLHVHAHLQANQARKSAPVGEGGLHAWMNDHDLNDCIMSFGDPHGLPPEQLRRVVRATPCLRVRIMEALDSSPGGTLPICRICEEITSNPKDLSMVLQQDADAIAYHMEVKHGRQFDNGDVRFGKPWYLPRYYM